MLIPTPKQLRSILDRLNRFRFLANKAARTYDEVFPKVFDHSVPPYLSWTRDIPNDLSCFAGKGQPLVNATVELDRALTDGNAADPYGWSPTTCQSLESLARHIGIYSQAIRDADVPERFFILIALSWDQDEQLLFFENCHLSFSGDLASWKSKQLTAQIISRTPVVMPAPPTSQPQARHGTRPKLAPSRERAFGQYLAAEEAQGKGITDQQAYDWLVEHEEIDPSKTTFATWSKYVRVARSAAGASKNTPRGGREAASAVRPSGKQTTEPDKKRTG
jgi:hypothetical protein